MVFFWVTQRLQFDGFRALKQAGFETPKHQADGSMEGFWSSNERLARLGLPIGGSDN